MKNATSSVRSSSTLAALAASIIGTNNAPPAGDVGGGVAVMEPPVRVKRQRRQSAAPAAPVVPAPEPPEVQPLDAATEKELELPPGSTAPLNVPKDRNLRDPSISKKDRKTAQEAAVAHLMAIGLGAAAKDEGHGPVIRAVSLRMYKERFDLKSIQPDTITAANLTVVMEAKDFKAKALAALDAHVAEMLARSEKRQDKTGVAPGPKTVAARDANVEKAKKWINAGMNVAYIKSLDIVQQLGGRVTIAGIAIPLDRLLGVAFGKSITALELYRKVDTAVVTKS